MQTSFKKMFNRHLFIIIIFNLCLVSQVNSEGKTKVRIIRNKQETEDLFASFEKIGLSQLKNQNVHVMKETQFVQFVSKESKNNFINPSDFFENQFDFETLHSTNISQSIIKNKSSRQVINQFVDDSGLTSTVTVNHGNQVRQVENFRIIDVVKNKGVNVHESTKDVGFGKLPIPQSNLQMFNDSSKGNSKEKVSNKLSLDLHNAKNIAMGNISRMKGLIQNNQTKENNTNNEKSKITNIEVIKQPEKSKVTNIEVIKKPEKSKVTNIEVIKPSNVANNNTQKEITKIESVKPSKLNEKKPQKEVISEPLKNKSVIEQSKSDLKKDQDKLKVLLAKKIKNIVQETPSNVNTKSDGNYRKIKIVWDRSILMKSLEELNMVDQFKKIHNLIFKVDNALKKYIMLHNDIEQKITIPKKFRGCHTSRTPFLSRSNFENEMSIEGDLMIFLVAEKEHNDILASASPCIKNENNRVFAGRLFLNLANLKLDYGSYYEQMEEILVVFHEVLHILAFHKTTYSGLYDQVKTNELPNNFDNLRKMKHLPKNPLIQEGHWDSAYLQNDLMAPIERIDSTLTIFTLEYLDLVSNEIRTDRSQLANNFILDEITDIRDFFSYKCDISSSKSKYSNFCTSVEQNKKEFGCDRSRIYKTYCGDERMKNGCYEKESLSNYICTNKYTPKKSISVFETYGDKSRCFNVMMNGSKAHAKCLEFEINQEGLFLKAYGAQYKCSRDKEVISMKVNSEGKFYTMDVICPDPNEFKRIYNLTKCPNNCYGNGFCSQGKCNCFDGFSESDNCKKKIVSSSTTIFTMALKI